MQSTQVQTISDFEGHWRELGDAPVTVQHPRPTVLDSDIIERAAQALFEFVFSSCGRLDGKQQWGPARRALRRGSEVRRLL